MKFIQDDCALESEDKAVGRRGLLGGIATLKGLKYFKGNCSAITNIFSVISSSRRRKKSFRTGSSV